MAYSKSELYNKICGVLLTDDKPSEFFSSLRNSGQLEEYLPELAALIGVVQPPKYHPEGDAWTHTMLVTDYAASLRESAEYPLGFMFSALFHDLGKPATTKVYADGAIHSIGHENELGTVRIALTRLTDDEKLIGYVLNMTKLHMRPNILASQNSGQKAFFRVFGQSVCPRDLLLLSESDYMGRDGIIEYESVKAALYERLEEYEEAHS